MPAARRRMRRRAAAATPRSVTSAVTSAAGVTSKAGLRTPVPGSVASTPANARTSSPSRSSISMLSPSGRSASMVEVGAATTNGMPAARGGQGQGIGADLVGGVAVGRHAVGAHDRRVDLAAADEPGHRAVDHEIVAHAGARELPHGQARALQQRPRLAGEDVDAAALVQLEDHRQRGPPPAGGQRTGVAVRGDPPRTRRAGRRRARRWRPRRRPPRRGCARPPRARRPPSTPAQPPAPPRGRGRRRRRG